MELCHYDRTKKERVFRVEAIEIPIVYNRFGDHDPDGLLYVLSQDAETVRREAEEAFLFDPPQPVKCVQPLVIRANLGDRILVHFSHSLSRRLSMHVQGLSYDVRTSDGASVGNNPDTTTDREITYCWYADQEGVFLFSDMGDTRSGEEGTNVHGLFGAIIVEPSEAVWLDPEDGEPLESGLFADIYTPGQKAFREYAVFFHDELEVKNKAGEQPTDPHTGLPSATTGISYRSEPMRNRMPLTGHPKDHGDEMGLPETFAMDGEMDGAMENSADSGEDISMSSWVYGDPAPPILKAYVGDPARIRLVHGGIKETHVFHLHNHQWRLEGENERSNIIDSISISPQECYTLDILHGAGSLNGMIGDAIFHCHLYPHFHEGMWTLWRVYDRLQDGSGQLPDGVRIPPLMPLRDRPLPPGKDAEHPGYPNFINGIFGERPLQPPLGILNSDGSNKIEPTELERANFVESFAPGALYTESCPCHAGGSAESLNCGTAEEEGKGTEDVIDAQKIKLFEIALVQARITYNKFGWHDPQGRFFVTKEELERHGGLETYIRKVECQEIQVEPLVIRVNAGDCIEIRLTNLLPEMLMESPFQMETITDIVGYHIHLVKFDTIVSDGAANGWNNIAGARKYETLIERFFADTQLNTVFFHDHLFANSHQMHGVFGALLVEEAGATFHDIRTGEELSYGTKAVIRRRNGSSFREFALFVHDFAFLFDRDGKPLNPPEVPGGHDDPGVMGINYRCEPMPERLSCCEDAACLFSSLVHGDPATPILETYPGDEMLLRLLDGAHEEQHSFNLTGMYWQKELNDSHSPLAAAQTIGISEAFNFRIDKPYGSGDYLYYYGGIDDVWLGLWGIVRAYEREQPCLKPLCQGRARILPLPPCPGMNAVIRKYEVAAIQTDIQYNRYGDHDPDGLVFVPAEDVEMIRCGKREVKPLILRANVGEWIEVTLHNLFEKEVPYFDYPRVPLDREYKPSVRVSLNPQFLHYDTTDSGINVGCNNREQTVGPGESRKYLWYADREYGACILQSFGDMRNHRYHGLFGMIIIEPAGARWYKSMPGAGEQYREQAVTETARGRRKRRAARQREAYGEQAVVTAPGRDTFREFTVFIQNGIRLLDINDELIKTATDDGEGVDDEDTGEKGYNYRSERFYNRLLRDEHISRVFSSKVHGDPATPVFMTYSGERVLFRAVMPADKPRNVGFAIHGHVWAEQPTDPFSRVIPLQGAVSIGGNYEIEPTCGASGPGDYLYRSGTLKWDVESGMWGILRVMKHGLGCKCREICRRVMGRFKR